MLGTLNHFLFIYCHGNITILILVYMDDLIVTRNSPRLVDMFIQRLDKNFQSRILAL